MREGKGFRRDNGGCITGEKSPRWFTDYFGEYDSGAFAGGDGRCAHCGSRKAMPAPCYRGLCNGCWDALMWHCMGWAERWLARRGEDNGAGRDPLELALMRIRANAERGTLDCLLRVAIDGASPRDEWRKVRARLNARRWRAENPQRSRESSRRWCRENHDRARENKNRWQRENREKVRRWNREQYIKRKAGKAGGAPCPPG